MTEKNPTLFNKTTGLEMLNQGPNPIGTLALHCQNQHSSCTRSFIGGSGGGGKGCKCQRCWAGVGDSGNCPAHHREATPGSSFHCYFQLWMPLLAVTWCGSWGATLWNRVRPWGQGGTCWGVHLQRCAPEHRPTQDHRWWYENQSAIVHFQAMVQHMQQQLQRPPTSSVNWWQRCVTIGDGESGRSFKEGLRFLSLKVQSQIL